MTSIVDTASSKVPSTLTLFVNGLAQKGLTMAFTAIGGYGITLAPDTQTKITAIALGVVGAAVSTAWTWLSAKIHSLRVDKAISIPASNPAIVSSLPLKQPSTS